MNRCLIDKNRTCSGIYGQMGVVVGVAIVIGLIIVPGWNVVLRYA